jgi:hypothetical protein
MWKADWMTGGGAYMLAAVEHKHVQGKDRATIYAQSLECVRGSCGTEQLACLHQFYCPQFLRYIDALRPAKACMHFLSMNPVAGAGQAASVWQQAVAHPCIHPTIITWLRHNPKNNYYYNHHLACCCVQLPKDFPWQGML